MGFINLSTGNLHLEIPLYTAEQRAKTPTSVKLVYDSRIWQTENLQPSGLTWQPNNLSSGWRLVRSDNGGTPFLFDNGGSCLGNFQMYTYHTYQRFAWADPMGTFHSFSSILTETTNSNCDAPPDDIPNSAAFADDNSGYYMSVTDYTTMSVYAKNGSLVYASNVDANGNTFDGTDTLGRIPVTSTINSNQTTYQVPNSQGTLSSYVATNGSVPYSTNFQQSGVNETSGNLTTLTSLTLPDNSSYSFGYDSYGELNSMTLPTGGQVTFGYSNFLDAYQNMNRWVTSRGSGGASWMYAPQVNSACQTGQQDCQQQVTVTKPSGDSILYTFRMNGGAWQTSAQYDDHLSGLLASVSQVWTLNQGGLSASQVVATTTTLPIGGGSISRQTESDFDAYSNLTKYKEWSFYTGSPGATPDRETDITYIDDISYNNANIYDLPSTVTVYSAGAQAAKTQYKYDTTALTCISTQVVQGGGNCSNTIRGNVTEIHRWIDNANTLPTVYLWYDNTGQVVQQQDTAGNLTQYFYSDNFYNDNGQSPPAATTDPAGQTNAYLTRVHSPIIGDVTFGYYLGSGKLAVATDANGVSTYHHYVDPLDRPTLTVGPAGAWTLSTYTSQTQQDTYTGITSSTPSTGCTGCIRISTILDGLGRLSRMSVPSDQEGTDIVDHTCDLNGRPYQVSNAYRSTTDPTYGLTATLYDGLDRALQITQPDGNTITTAYGPAVGTVSQSCSPATYGIGFPILNTDEAGKKRLTWSDGLGRIIETDEPNSSGQLNVNTCYKHDALNNLIQVVQQGETRTYTYDQIGRLTSATDPESQQHTVSTSYMSGANQCSGDPTLPCSRTDARFTTTFSYDALNRLTGKTYTDPNTPSISYFYDQTSYNGLTITNGKGRRTGMSDSSGQTAWSFDPAGRVLAEQRTITAVSPSITKSFGYAYNLDGSLASLTYPSGRTVAYFYNNAQRQTSAIDSANATNYATNATYWATGQLHTAVLGNDHTFAGTTLTQAFNNRLQYTSISATNSFQTVFSTSYNYADGSGHNNGRLLSETNNVTSSRSQTFSYDPYLNRLASWQNGVSGDSYQFDTYGNLTNKAVTLGTAETLNVTLNSFNQITTGGYGYDAAGDMISSGSHAFTFDAESRETSAGTATYKYDGDSLRVYKFDSQSSSNNRLYWRGGGVSVLSHTDLSGNIQKELIYFAGMPIASYNGTNGDHYYLYEDWQGSVRAITNSSGSTTEWAADYFPWGQVQNQIANSIDWRYRWVGQEYDPEVQSYSFPSAITARRPAAS